MNGYIWVFIFLAALVWVNVGASAALAYIGIVWVLYAIFS